MASKSIKEMEYRCLQNGCNKIFKTLSGRSKHHRTCDKEFVEKDKGYIIIGGKKVQCKDCKKVFSEVANWHKHYRNVHIINTRKEKIKKMFKCLVCSKEFPKQSKLIRHEATHLKEPKICTYCGQTFKRIDHFDSHFATCTAKEMQNSGNRSQDMVVTMVDDYRYPREMSLEDEDPNVMWQEENSVTAEIGSDTEAGAMDEMSILESDVDGNDDQQDNMVIVQMQVDAIDEQLNSEEIDVEVHVFEKNDENVNIGLDDIEKKQVHRNTRVRKTANLSNVLQKIITTNMEPGDQEKIIQRSLETTVNRTVLDNLMLPTNTNSINESKLLSGILEYLKRLDLRTNNNKKQFVEILSNICEVKDSDLNDDDFLQWLSNRIDKRYENVLKVMQSDEVERRGRRGKTLETCQAIFNIWHEFSIVTVDRRNSRDQMKIREIEYLKRYKDLVPPEGIEIEYFMNKRGQRMVRSTRRISTKTGHQIRAKLLQVGYHVSYGTVLNYKPFYVQKPCEREKESCLI